MCAVKHTVCDPRRQQVVAGSAHFFDVPGQTRSAPTTSAGRRTCARDSAPKPPLSTISECGDVPQDCASERSGALTVYRDAKHEPWRSPAVADFASQLSRDDSLKPMVLQGPRGTALRAVGEVADHEVATKTVASIEGRRKQTRPGPSVDHGEARLMQSGYDAAGRRGGSKRGTELAIAAPGGAVVRPQAAFGAVYEYRDSCGTPKVVASTSTVPERQFALDRRQYEGALSHKAEPNLVWVGMSGGHGGLNEAEMTEVRRNVASARAERLQAQKLSDIKPYSRHG
eukprot:TRINITY_DN55911_c0_g2_i4.p2 TRINITY_DN55911_c0_g2~~TRINITY_DN55911_c0_g2_i4.p2  ORF type:complete len:285 (+),score=51.34 TRINITY_DN55911_c0_g2_i4:77-931(+)